LYNINDKFVKLHPDFLGFKVIMAVYRGYEMDKLKETVEEFKQLQ